MSLTGGKKVCDGSHCQFRHFRCGKKALKVLRQGNRVVALCTLFGGECIGGKCQFALCEAHAMGPDGSCLLELRMREEAEKSIEEEAKKFDAQAVEISKHLKKLGLRDYI